MVVQVVQLLRLSVVVCCLLYVFTLYTRPQPGQTGQSSHKDICDPALFPNVFSKINGHWVMIWPLLAEKMVE